MACVYEIISCKVLYLIYATFIKFQKNSDYKCAAVHIVMC